MKVELRYNALLNIAHCYGNTLQVYSDWSSRRSWRSHPSCLRIVTWRHASLQIHILLVQSGSTFRYLQPRITYSTAATTPRRSVRIVRWHATSRAQVISSTALAPTIAFDRLPPKVGCVAVLRQKHRKLL